VLSSIFNHMGEPGHWKNRQDRIKVKEAPHKKMKLAPD